MTWFVDLCNKYGNVASVVGLLITVLGFLVTLIKLALIEKETKKTRRESREALERLVLQQLSFEVGNLNHLVELLDEALRNRKSAIAIERCRHLMTATARVAGHSRLSEEENIRFRNAYDDFSLIIRDMQNAPRGRTPVEIPTVPQRSFLDGLASSFLAVESRLRHTLPEIRHD